MPHPNNATKAHEGAFRCAVALSNSSASLVSEHAGSIETVALPALATAITLMQQLCTDSRGVSNAKPRNLSSASQDNAFLSQLMQFVKDIMREANANRYLSPGYCIPRKMEVSLSKMDGFTVHSLVEMSRSKLALFLSANLEDIIDTRPILITDCCSEIIHATMRTDLVSAVILYNLALGFLVLGHIKANELETCYAKELVQMSRHIFRLALNILLRYKAILARPFERGWLVAAGENQDDDMIQTSALFLFVWVSVLISDYQAALVLVLSSEEAVAFEDDHFQPQVLFLQQLAGKLLAALEYIYGNDSRGRCVWHEAAPAA